MSCYQKCPLPKHLDTILVAANIA